MTLSTVILVRLSSPPPLHRQSGGVIRREVFVALQASRRDAARETGTLAGCDTMRRKSRSRGNFKGTEGLGGEEGGG